MMSLEREKVLYEIAMSIGNTLDVELMGKEVLATLLKKLSATSGAIIQHKSRGVASFEDVLFAIPKRIKQSAVYEEVFDAIGDKKAYNVVHQSSDGKSFYIFELKGVGCLVLIRNTPLDTLIVHSLVPIMEKIAVALHACFNYEQLQMSLKKAKVADKAKSQFLANMSHEIRTPLNGIVGFLELLKKSGLNDHQLHYLNIIDSTSHTLLQVINDILDFSKIEAGELGIEYIPFDLHYELKMIFELFSIKAEEQSIGFMHHIDPQLPQVIVSDKVRIKQILVNLVNNAIKFTHKGHVKVGVSVKEMHQETNGDFVTWRVEVSDTGIGIAEDKIALILHPFKQSNNSVTRDYGGTGLGLSITKELIELLGGRLVIDSEEEVGSTFSFEMKSKVGEAYLEDKMIETSQEHTFDAKVLVAEDNPVNQMLISELLNEMSVTYDLAENGEEAYQLFKENEYDLVLMDHNMPIMDGAKALALILAYEEEQKSVHTPVIALTANALHGDEERFLAMGFDAYMAKPIETAKLKFFFSRFVY
jgi:signal transduction histidine kinase/CheY-like chemotaxis protein